MSLSIQQVGYHHADKEILFQQVSFTINNGHKASLIGNNGSGKSTLLRIIAGELAPTQGTIIAPEAPYYIPQHFGQYNHLTIAQALKVEERLAALNAIVQGDASAENFTILNDDWDIEERLRSALSAWDLSEFEFNHPLANMSGGEKTRVFLAGINLHAPGLILLDEPTNHLDAAGRKKLYDFIERTNATTLIVSHDIALLNLLSYTYELGKESITAYGGNYDFYREEKEKTIQTLQAKLEEKEKELRLARKQAREVLERKQKHEVRGEKQNNKKGIPRIVLKGLKDQAERSGNKLKETHEEKQQTIRQDLSKVRQALPDISQMKVNFNHSTIHQGKILIKTKELNYTLSSEHLWDSPLTFQLASGDRVAIEGDNGSGKTTLIKLLIGELPPDSGELYRVEEMKHLYIDQEYTIINPVNTVVEQAWYYNDRNLPDHEIKMLLNRYLFSKESWEKGCDKLSGGEKMRLALCCLAISDNTPDLIILDEPTNNIDIRNMEILTATIRDYKGSLLVVSHDRYFKESIGIDRWISLNKRKP